MAEDPKPPPDGKKGPPRPRPRRSALDMRVLSSSIVADVESAPVKVPEPPPEPGPDVIAAAPPAAMAQAAPDAPEVDDLAVVQAAGTRFVWLLGAIALALALVLGVAMPRAAKRVDKRAAVAAVAKPEPGAENAPRAGAATTPAQPEPEIEMKAEPATAASGDNSNAAADHDRATAGAKDDGSKATAKDDGSKAAAKDDRKDDAKDDAKDDPAPKSGSRIDPKRAAEAELAYRDGEQRAAIGDTDGALKSLKRAADLDPGYAPTYRALGDVYAKRGETGKARGAYQRYLKLAPRASDAGKVRGRLEAL